jgi:hypothetical protein
MLMGVNRRNGRKTVLVPLFNVLLTAHLGSVIVNNQLDAQFFSYMFIPFMVCGSLHPQIFR